MTSPLPAAGRSQARSPHRATSGGAKCRDGKLEAVTLLTLYLRVIYYRLKEWATFRETFLAGPAGDNQVLL